MLGRSLLWVVECRVGVPLRHCLSLGIVRLIPSHANCPIRDQIIDRFVKMMYYFLVCSSNSYKSQMVTLLSALGVSNVQILFVLGWDAGLCRLTLGTEVFRDLLVSYGGCH